MYQEESSESDLTGRFSGRTVSRNFGRSSTANQIALGINDSLTITKKTLRVVGIVNDIYRTGVALKDDIYIHENADEIIEELEDEIDELRWQLKNEESYRRRQNIRDKIKHLKIVIRDVKRSKKVPAKAIKTVSSCAGSMTAGAIGGTGDAYGGLWAGAQIGGLFGPAGALIGAPIGAFLGSLSAGKIAGQGGSYIAETVAEKTFETFLD